MAVARGGKLMKDIIVRSLRKEEKKRFFEFARSLPDRGFWGKKGSPLRGDFKRFQEFFGYIESFQSRRFLVAEEDNKLVGFVVAIYNPTWISDLKERYGHDVDKRAYVLGIAFVQRRKDVLNALTDEVVNYFSRKGVRSVEYPTLGNVCLTTATDVLTPENIDALIMFREAGFRISECYYSMKLNLDSYEYGKEGTIKEGSFRFKQRSIEVVRKNEVLGKIKWNHVENAKTSIGVCVEPAYRGKSLGTALMAKALNLLKAEGRKVIELGVDGNNIPALKLYRKFNFEPYATHFYMIASSGRIQEQKQTR
jgi:ribosomal protein S18 acetylase RimI-like enzyme